MRNFKDKLKRYFPFSKSELNSFLLIVLVFAVIFSFDKWGVDKFDFLLGIKNLLIALVIVLAGVFVHHAAQRIAALAFGYKAEHKVWWTGLLVSFFVTLLTNGKFPVFAASSVMPRILPAHRLGKPFKMMQSHIGFIALSGPLANIIVAAIAGLFPGALAAKIVLFNILFAAFSLLPLPPLDGAHVFFASRLTYVFIACTIIGFALIAGFVPISTLAALLLAVFIGIICWLIFYLAFERFQ